MAGVRHAKSSKRCPWRGDALLAARCKTGPPRLQKRVRLPMQGCAVGATGGSVLSCHAFEEWLWRQSFGGRGGALRATTSPASGTLLRARDSQTLDTGLKRRTVRSTSRFSEVAQRPSVTRSVVISPGREERHERLGSHAYDLTVCGESSMFDSRAAGPILPGHRYRTLISALPPTGMWFGGWTKIVLTYFQVPFSQTILNVAPLISAPFS